MLPLPKSGLFGGVHSWRGRELKALCEESRAKHIVDAVNTVNLDERKQERSLREGVRNVRKGGMKELFSYFKSTAAG